MTRIVLDLVADGRGDGAATPVAGSLTTETGAVNPFVGWAELLVLLEKSISPSPEQTRPDTAP